MSNPAATAERHYHSGFLFEDGKDQKAFFLISMVI